MEFIPSVEYHDGWVAVVSRRGAMQPGYWKGSRFTRVGATFAAKRKAAKLNRLFRKGLVR